MPPEVAAPADAPVARSRKTYGVSTEELIRRHQAGQPAAFDALFERYKDYAVSYTHLVTPTVTPTPVGFPEGVSLNEYLPDPASDWDGDGLVTACLLYTSLPEMVCHYYDFRAFVLLAGDRR